MPELLPSTLAWLITAVLTLYGLTAGAELGAGLWHGLARGRRGVITRLLIDEALSPIWEANHVWLIFLDSSPLRGLSRCLPLDLPKSPRTSLHRSLGSKHPWSGLCVSTLRSRWGH